MILRRGPLRTLRGRIALALTAGLVVAAVIFAVVSSELIRQESEVVARSEIDRQVVALANTLGRQTAEQATRGEALQIDSDEYLAVLGGPATSLYYSGNPLSPIAGPPGGPIPVAVELDSQTISDDGLQRVEFEDPATGGVRVGSIAPVPVRGETWGFLLLARPPEQLGSPWGAIGGRVAAAAGLGVLVALLLGLFLTQRLTRPMRAMRAATHRVAGGNLRTQLGQTGTRELDDLIDDFNEMVRQLAHRDGANREFLMRITHDLRTPLTAIRGHAAALSDGVVPEAERPRSLAAIEGEAARLESMVADLLDLARRDARRFSLTPGPGAPRGLAAQALDAVRALAGERGVTLHSTAEGAPGRVESDEMRVLQIVGNLLQNAVLWTPTGGEVHLDVTGDDAGGVRLVVTDSGPGVPPGSREEIFAPFQATDRPDGSRGSGLGLTISRELARALGGELTVTEHEGGARFELTLPATVPATVPGTVPGTGPGTPSA
ncbi:MAG: HAMP domain-containing sensor histidine kinase [Miltoncostaeaceae bacterium]